MLLTAMADPNNKIAEINESNNSRTYTIAINESVPDLTITALTSDKQTYEAGDTVTVNATVANLGGTGVSACDVRLMPGSLPAITKDNGSNCRKRRKHCCYIHLYCPITAHLILHDADGDSRPGQQNRGER